jgi:arylsulfatase
LCVAVVTTGGCASSREDSAAPARQHGPVVLIIVDALRADHLGTYGYRRRPTAPNIDRWAESGLVYEQAWSASSWTLPSFGSIFTGYLPSAHGAGIEVESDSALAFRGVEGHNFVILPESVPTLAAMLRGAGFATAGFVANPFLHPNFGFGRGFDHYDHDDGGNAGARLAAKVIDRALEWIDGRPDDQPFFLMVHLMDPHLDYDAPAPFGGRFTREIEGDFELPVEALWPIRGRAARIDAAERDFISAAYDEEIAYVDAQIERLLEALSQRGVTEDGLVLLTADHGEELFDHGGFEHGHSMYEEVLHVPLILWGAAVGAGRASTPVSLLDVAPTMLDAAGVAAPMSSGADGNLPGISLLDPDSVARAGQRTIVAERLLYGPATKAVLRWPYKAIVEVDGGAAKLFDLQADPGEHDNLAQQRPEQLAALLTELAERVARAHALGVAPQAPIDELLLHRLRALGYIR